MNSQHIANFKYDQHQLENAINFLSLALKKSGSNPKPVLIHSILVGAMLWERGITQEAVIAAILHDIIEDTDTTLDNVRQEFGNKVATYVDALTINNDIRFEDSFANCAKLGTEAVTIRAADLIQNSYYYRLSTPDAQKRLKSKYEYFLKHYGDLIDRSLKEEFDDVYRKNVAVL